MVPADAGLDVLHEVFQIAFGWTDSHLHDFEVGEVRFAVLSDEDELFAVEERGAPVGAMVLQGSSFTYRYDFGDDWEHEVVVEDIVAASTGPVRIECLDGARAGPPEDCGGTSGYEEMLRVLADPDDDEHRNMKMWVGRAYSPEKFDIDKVNKKLAVLARRMARFASRRRAQAGGRTSARAKLCGTSTCKPHQRRHPDPCRRTSRMASNSVRFAARGIEGMERRSPRTSRSPGLHAHFVARA